MRFLGIIVALLIAATPVYAAPSISSATYQSGGLGQQISISGSGFGADKPDILVFDTFENGTTDAALATDDADIGFWADPVGEPTVKANGNARYGSKSLLTWTDSTNKVVIADTRTSGPYSPDNYALFTEFFVSYWLKDASGFLPCADPGGWPDNGAGGPLSVSKHVWLILDDDYSGDGHDLWAPGAGGSLYRWSAFGTNVVGQNDRTSTCINGDSSDGTCPIWDAHTDPGGASPGYWRFNDWNRWYWWVKIDTSSPYTTDSSHSIGFFNQDIHSFAKGLNNSRFMIDQSANGYSHAAWDRAVFHGYIRSTCDGGERYVDNFYVAIGSNAQARVEIGNNSSYFNCTKLAIAPATAWSSTGITASVETSAFNHISDDGVDDVYAFVIDGDGVASGGELLSEGNGSPPAPPASTMSGTGTMGIAQ